MKLSSLKQQIEELDATKGPWEKSHHNGLHINSDAGHVCQVWGDYSQEESNADFIALSRTALPELLRRLLVAEEAFGNILKMTAGHYGIDKTANAALKTIRGEEE